MNNITNMTREEINKFSGVEPYCFETDREEDWYNMGCIDGLEAADAEPNIRRLWHNPSEEPQDDLELIIYKYKDNFWFTRKQNIIKYHNSWKHFISEEQMILWAYVNDLFPKGGDK